MEWHTKIKRNKKLKLLTNNLGASRLYAKLVKNINDISSIVEFGAGTGLLTEYLSKKFKCEDITLIDRDINVCVELKKTYPYAKVICSDIRNLKLKRKFDLVHSGGVMEHFISLDRENVIDNHCAYSRKYVLFHVPVYNFWYWFFSKFKLQRIGWFVDWEFPFTERELSYHFEKRGFEKTTAVKFFFGLGMMFKKI